METRGNYVLQGTGSKGNRTADAREQRDRARESRCIVPLHPRQEDIAVEFGTRVRRTIFLLNLHCRLAPPSHLEDTRMRGRGTEGRALCLLVRQAAGEDCHFAEQEASCASIAEKAR